MPPLPRCPKYRPVLGFVQVVPPRRCLTAPPAGAPPGQTLRSGAYMAPNKKRDQSKISPIRVSTLSGEPRSPVFQPSVLRGRLLILVATASISSAFHLARSVPLGKYCLSRPLVFSFVGRCHGLCRSAK